MSNAAEVADATFQEEVLSSAKPVLVDFWAPWCGPCRAMAPAVDKLAAELGDQAKIVKLNTEDSPGVPAQYGVMAIPTFIVFKGGEEVGRHTGGMNYDQLKALVEAHV
ncbi:MAG: thioredoxin [Planctomycetes bacterium]|nr:thioredoxin [Planctomycetota bacterium]MBL7008743.1 thioredoxin [Planctomycetota bacterium]